MSPVRFSGAAFLEPGSHTQDRESVSRGVIHREKMGFPVQGGQGSAGESVESQRLMFSRIAHFVSGVTLRVPQ